MLTDSSEDGRHHGALMRPTYCCNEACHCNEIQFEVSRIDEPFAGVHEDDVRIQRVLDDDAAESSAVMLRLELRIGRFSSIGLEDSEPGDKPEPEPDQILDGGADDYCPNPTCTCGEAHVSFATAEGSIGTVIVNFETDELCMA